MLNFRRSPHLISLADARAAGPSGSRSAPPTLDKHLLDYVRVLVKRRWTAAGALMVAMVLAGLHLYTAVPIYQTAAQILIEHENQNAFSLRDQVAQDRETTDYYNTQYTILQSRSMAKRTIEQMGAWKHPELSRNSRIGPVSVFEGATRGVRTAFDRLRGSAEAAPAPAAGAAVNGPAPVSDSAPAGGDTGSAETAAQAHVIDAFLSRLTIAPVENSRMVDVKMIGADPKFAAEAANALAQTYIERNLEVRMASSKETSDWLTQQLSEQRRRIEVSEGALQRYRERHDAVSLADRQNIVGQKLTDLNAMVTRAKADRISRETLYNQLRGIQTSGEALDSLPAILANPYLQQLRNDLSRLQAERARRSQDLLDGHPEMVRLTAAIADADEKLQREIARQSEAMKNEYQASVTLENNLMQALDAQKREATEMGRTGIDYGVLEREVLTNRQIFESLLERTREKGIAGELKASDVRIIDPAQVPRTSIWPKRNETLLYALLFGTLIGIGFAFFAEYLDDRIKTPDEIKTYLGLPFLGLVPIIEGKPNDQSSAAPLLHTNVSPLFAESFRTVRTNLLFSADQRAKSIVVTSTGPAEGKTVVSSNLAIGLAMAGRKVLLIDVDLRRPRIHKVFGIAQTPGLADVLSGEADFDQATHPSPVPGLWIMPSGSHTGNPVERLSSPQFAQTLSALSERYGWVIIDSPPVGAVTDSCIVANRASAVLFVVGAQLTRRSAALHAIEQLDVANATFVGAILNKVRLRRDAYYYSPYYRPDYEKYYSSTSS